MLSLAILIFSVAILIGLYLFSFVVRKQSAPKPLIFLHGGLVLIGFLILIIYSIFHTPSPIFSMIIFGLAALGGITMVYREFSKKPFPVWMVWGHGIVALLGFIFLIIFAIYQ